MLTKSIDLATVPSARWLNDIGLTLMIIVFALLFAMALLSAFMHPATGETFEMMAML